MLPNKFDQIIVEDGKAYLYDARAEGIRRERAKDFADAYEGIRRMLLANGYPASREWIDAIAADGSDGLRRMVQEETERRIKADAVPPFIASMWRRTCTSEVPVEMYGNADAARRAILDNGEGLPVQPGDFVYLDEHIVALDTICGRISQACRIEITDQMRDDAKRVVKLAQEVRTLSVEKGLNALQLVRKYARADEIPAPSSPSVLEDIVFRRHEPGRMEDEVGEVMNRIGMQTIPMKH